MEMGKATGNFEAKDLRAIFEEKYELIHHSESQPKRQHESLCLELFDSLEQCLIQSSLQYSKTESGLSPSVVEEVLYFLLVELGQGHKIFRKSLWKILGLNIKELKVLDTLFKFFPSAAPPLLEDELKARQLQFLLRLLETSGIVLPYVLNAVSIMIQTGQLNRADGFSFALKSLPNVLERDLHHIVSFAIQYIGNDDDAKVAVESIRSEIHMVMDEKTPDRDLCIALTARSLCKVQRVKGGILFFDAFLGELEDCTSKDKIQEDAVVDLIVLILHNNSPELGTSIARIWETVLIDRGIDPTALFLLERVILLRNTSGDEQSLDQGYLCDNELLEALLALPIFLLRAPLCVDGFSDTGKHLVHTRDFVIRLLRNLERSKQERLVTSMLCLVDEMVDELDKSVDDANDACPVEQINRIFCTIFEILNDVSSDIAGVLFSLHAVIWDMLQSIKGFGQLSRSVFQHHCRLLSNLHRIKTQNCQRSSQEDQEVFDPCALVRSLLFPSVPDVRLDKKRAAEHRARGFMLAAEMIDRGGLLESQVRTIWTASEEILVHCSHQRLPGVWGVSAISYMLVLHGWCRLQKSTTRSRLGSGIFARLTQMLSSTGIICYHTERNRPTKKTFTLCHGQLPNEMNEVLSKGPSRGMAFTFNRLLRNPLMEQPSNWESTREWVFSLVDAYLTLGQGDVSKIGTRSGSEWVPHPWIEAAVELPLVMSAEDQTNNSPKQRSLETIRLQVLNLDSSLAFQPQTSHRVLERQLYDMLKHAKSGEEVAETIGSLFRLALSLILYDAMLAAVLNNAFMRYRNVFDKSISKGKLVLEAKEPYMLIQFQMRKLIDTRRRCEELKRYLKCIKKVADKAAKIRKLSRGINKNVLPPLIESQDRLRGAIAQLGGVKLNWFQISGSLHLEILWACLLDPTQDTVLVEAVRRKIDVSLQQSEGSFFSVSSVVQTKLLLLEEIVKHISPALGMQAQPWSLFSFVPQLPSGHYLRPEILQCVRLCVLLSHIPEGEESCVDEIQRPASSLLSVLAASLFQLLSASVIAHFESKQTVSDVEAFEDATALDDVIALLKTDCPMDFQIGRQWKISSAQKRCHSLSSSLLPHFQRCRGSPAASHILDILTLLATESESITLESLIDLSWSDLNLQSYKNLPTNLFKLPYAFLLAAKKLAPRSLLKGANRNLQEKVLASTMVKLAFRKSTDRASNHGLVYGMLRHYGMIALSISKGQVLCEHIFELSMNLRMFLEDVVGPIATKPTFVDTGGVSDEDEEYFPPERENSPCLELPKSRILGLNSMPSFHLYFEVVLYMIVCTLSIMPLPENCVNRKVKSTGGTPYELFENLAKEFGCVLQLCQVKIYLFPLSMRPTIVYCCKLVLEVAHHQLNRCVEWRSVQPLTLRANASPPTDDVASTMHVDRLLKVLVKSLVQNVHIFCDRVDPRIQKSVGEDPHSHHANRRTNIDSLRAKNGRFLEKIRKIANVHNVAQPTADFRTDKIPVVATRWERPRRKIQPEGTVKQSHDNMNKEEHTEESMVDSHAKGRRLVGIASSEEACGGDELSKSLSFSDVSFDSTSSDGFGASGDWGVESVGMKRKRLQEYTKTVL